MSIIASPVRSRPYHGLRRLAPFGAALMLAFASLMPSLAQANAATEARRAAELETLRTRVAELDRQLLADRRKQDALLREIEDAEKALAVAARSARGAEAAQTAQREKVKAAHAARAQTLAHAEQRREDLARALRASYVAGNPGRLQLMFRQDSTADLGRLDADVASLAHALQQGLTELQAALNQLAQAEAALSVEQDALEQRTVAARQTLADLAQAQRDRREKLDQLSRRESSQATELAQAKSEQARLEKLLEDLRQALKESPTKFESGVPFKQQRGRLPWPLRGALLARFGSSKGEGPLTWRGLWIKSAAGAPVRGVADGRVVYVGRLQRFGLVVIVDHPGQYLSIYGHLQDAQVEVGETLKAGARVGAAGNSGGHEQTGVYFEIREGADAIDPRAWLAP